MLTIGVDAHKGTHVAVAVDAAGQECGQWQGPNSVEGWAAIAARSRADSSHEVNAAVVGPSGRGKPTGGISPVRTLRNTFSQMFAPAPTFSKLMPSSTIPAVCSFWL